MYLISFANLKRLKREEAEKYFPLIITFDGEEAWVVDKKDEVLAIGDLHPAVKHTLRARAELARSNMPPIQTINLGEIIKKDGSEPEIKREAEIAS